MNHILLLGHKYYQLNININNNKVMMKNYRKTNDYDCFTLIHLNHICFLLSTKASELYIQSKAFQSQSILPQHIYPSSLFQQLNILYNLSFNKYKYLMLKNITRLYSNFTTTIFNKIIDKQIPSKTVYEDDLIYVFHDISPQAPVHVLILIPKNKDGLTGISKASEKHASILGYMMIKIPHIAQILGLQKGYRLVINEGSDGQQTVSHLHIHLIGGRQMKWPPG